MIHGVSRNSTNPVPARSSRRPAPRRPGEAAARPGALGGRALLVLAAVLSGLALAALLLGPLRWPLPSPPRWPRPRGGHRLVQLHRRHPL